MLPHLRSFFSLLILLTWPNACRHKHSASELNKYTYQNPILDGASLRTHFGMGLWQHD